MPLTEVTVHVHLASHADVAEIQQGLRTITGLLHALQSQGVSMSAALDRLTTEVSETATVVDSAIALISGLADQIRALQTDPAALAALADALDAKQAELAAAVAANTPA
jgi:septal ring factor EnvC (AmiA/AmiB activator)